MRNLEMELVEDLIGKMELEIANDIGNSETKTKFNGHLVKQPSVIKFVYEVPPVKEIDIKKNVANLLDDLIVNVTSKAIARNGLYMVGKRATLHGKNDNMNILLGNKYKHDIPVIMTLSMTAAKAVKSFYEEEGVLPKNIIVESKMSTAIPASEFTYEKAAYLENRFLDGTHIVIVYVGNELVTVQINFKQVKVMKEGVPSLYALLESDKNILNRYNETYKKDAIPKDFRNKKILHVEIGDGTTEYIYTIGMNPEVELCSGEKRGVGHATEEAVKLLINERNGNLKINRQQFMDILRDPSHISHDSANKFMDMTRYNEGLNIIEDVQKKYYEIAGNLEVLAVYGGGSIQFENELYEPLLDFANSVKCELLYIPEEYAVDMNVNGLDVLNRKVLFKTKG
ncbi:ParM/StbA family protein [Gottfriedia solisilvae]|uniref:ParM/StbA family protein n=1 Tax=Gottfriedia solisilvae TaxID=1516104 RepID=UPI003D2F3E19